MNRLKILWQEPLVLFLALGGLLYWIYAAVNPNAAANIDPKEIRIDRAKLLEFMQYRDKVFEPTLFAQQLDGMPTEDRKKLIDDYVQEEALYREAEWLGLEKGDYIIRQRMIQKLKFLLEDANAQGPAPTQYALDKFYGEHGSDYAEPPIYTFTHVFFDKTLRQNPRVDAEKTLKEFNATHAKFNDSIKAGDRPLYFQNYVERTHEFVVDHFGATMIAAIDKLPVGDDKWYGPFESPSGWHIVMLNARVPGRIPPLSELKQRVTDDYKAYLENQRRNSEIQNLVKQYHVEITPDVTRTETAKSAVP
jgi:hypothetical protein